MREGGRGVRVEGWREMERNGRVGGGRGEGEASVCEYEKRLKEDEVGRLMNMYIRY